MKILLLGGTGAMGTHLSKLLSEQKYNIVVTTRKERKADDFISYKCCDAKNIDHLHILLKENWDCIVDFMVYSLNEFKERVDLLLNSTNQYIFLSSARVYNNSKEALTEKSDRLLDSIKDEEYLFTNEYALSKARQENILKISSKKNWTIIRPYITYSEERFQLGTLEKEYWLYRALQGRTIVFSEDIKKHITTLTYGLDVSTAMSDLINQPNVLGETFHITNSNSIKWEEILNIYLDILENRLGKRPKVAFQNIDEYLFCNDGKYQVSYDRLFDRRFNNDKISQDTDVNNFLDTEVGLKRCLEIFLDNPKFNNINWKSEARKDKFTNEKTPLSEINGIKQKIKYLLYRYFI